MTRLALARPVDEAADVVLGVAQVGLHDDAGLVVAGELVLVEQLLEDGEGEVAVAELLEVEVHEGAGLLGLAEDRAQTLLDRLHRAAEVERVDLREERGDLDGDVDARHGAPGGLSMIGSRRQQATSLPQAVEKLEVALLIVARPRRRRRRPRRARRA